MKRSTWSAIPAVLMTLTIVGCESFSNGPASISRDGDNLRVALCEDFQVTRVTGNADYGSVRVPFLQMEGFADLVAGTVFEPGVEVEGLTGDSEPVRPEGLDTVTLVIAGTRGDFNATFHDSQLLVVPDGSWLQTDGSVTAEPCPN